MTEIIIIVILAGLIGLLMYRKVVKANNGKSCCK